MPNRGDAIAVHRRLGRKLFLPMLIVVSYQKKN